MDRLVELEKDLYNILNNKFLFNLKEPSLGPEAQIRIYKFLLQLYDQSWTWASSVAVPDFRSKNVTQPSHSVTKQFKSDLVIISGHLNRMDLGHLIHKLEDILADGKFGRILSALIAKLEVRFNKKELSDRVGKLRKREFLLASKSFAKKIAVVPKICSSTHTFTTEPPVDLPIEQANVIPLGRQLKRTPLKPSKNDHPQPGLFAVPAVRICFVANPISSTVTAPIDHDDERPIRPSESPNSTFTIEPTSVRNEDKEDIVNQANKPSPADKAMQINKVQPEDDGHDDQPIRPLKSPNSTFTIEPTSVHTEDKEDIVNPDKKPKRKPCRTNKEIRSANTQTEDSSQSPALAVTKKGNANQLATEAVQIVNMQVKDIKSLIETENQKVAENPVLTKKGKAIGKNRKAVNKNILKLDSNGTTVCDSVSTAEKEAATQSEKLLISPEKRKPTANALQHDNVQVEDIKSLIETVDQKVAENPVLTKKGKAIGKKRKATNKNILELDSNGTTKGDSISTAENEEVIQSEKLLVSPEKRKRTAKALLSLNVQAEDANKSSVETEDQEVAGSPVLTKKGKANRKAANKNILKLDSNGTTVCDSISTAENEAATQSEKLLISPEKRKPTAKALQNDNMQVEDTIKSLVETEDQEVAESPVLTKKGKAIGKNRKATKKNILELYSNGTTKGDSVSTAEKAKVTQNEKLLVLPEIRKRTAKALQNVNVQAEDVYKSPVKTEEQEVAVNPILTKKSLAVRKNFKAVNKEVLELDNNGTTMGDDVSTAGKEQTVQMTESLVSPAKPKRKRKVTKQSVSETTDLNGNDDNELLLTAQASNVAYLPVKAEIKMMKSATAKVHFNPETTSQSFHVQEGKKPNVRKNDPPAAKDDSKNDLQLTEKPGASKKQAKVTKSNDSEKENPVPDLKSKPKKTKGSSKTVDEDAISPVLERRVLRQRKHVSYLES